MQLSQILFWLQFLNSAIPLSSSSSYSSSKWQVMIVGLRADAKHPSSCISNQVIGAWQHKFKRLPLYKKEVFSVSSMTSSSSVTHFFQKLEEECQRIFQFHSVQVPTSYRNLLRWIEKENESMIRQQNECGNKDDHHQYFVSVNDLHTKYSSFCASSEANRATQVEVTVMKRILRYLHAIGHIVVVDDDTVCTNPTIIPKIVANFISPEEVRVKLFKERNIEILDEDNIKCLLNIDESSDAKYFFCFFSLLNN